MNFLHHTSWEVDDVDEIARGARSLLENHPERHIWGPSRHWVGANYFYYFRDPSGHSSEYFSHMDRITEDEAWKPEVHGEVGGSSGPTGRWRPHSSRPTTLRRSWPTSTDPTSGLHSATGSPRGGEPTAEEVGAARVEQPYLPVTGSTTRSHRVPPRARSACREQLHSRSNSPTHTERVMQVDGGPRIVSVDTAPKHRGTTCA